MQVCVSVVSVPFRISIDRGVHWVNIDGHWTRYSVMGTDISEQNLCIQNAGEQENRIVVLMIPGNPGHEGLYEDFGRRLLHRLQKRQGDLPEEDRKVYLFYTVSYVNHVPVPETLQKTSSRKTRELCSMNYQIEHKLKFIRQYVPRAKEVFVLAHSMGSYITLSILHDLEEDFNIVRVIGLFPAVERLAMSPYGRMFALPFAVMGKMETFVHRVLTICHYVPVVLKQTVVRWVCTFGMPPPLAVVNAATEVLHSDILLNMLHLANGEMMTVKQFDEALLTRKEKIFLFYGVNDGWVPIDYGNEMVKRLPEGHVIIDENDCGHGFILKDAEKIVDVLMDKLH